MDKKLESYLQTVELELGNLETEQRDSELREMRQHLEAIVARLVEGGLSEREAIEAAIAQFGSARNIGDELSQITALKESRVRVVAAVLTAMATYVIIVITGIIASPKLFQIATDLGWETNLGWGQAWLIPLSVGFVAAFVAGIVADTIAPYRGKHATLWTFGSVLGLIYIQVFFTQGLIFLDCAALLVTMLALWIGPCVGVRRVKMHRPKSA